MTLQSKLACFMHWMSLLHGSSNSPVLTSSHFLPLLPLHHLLFLRILRFSCCFDPLLLPAASLIDFAAPAVPPFLASCSCSVCCVDAFCFCLDKSSSFPPNTPFDFSRHSAVDLFLIFWCFGSLIDFAAPAVPPLLAFCFLLFASCSACSVDAFCFCLGPSSSFHPTPQLIFLMLCCGSFLDCLLLWLFCSLLLLLHLLLVSASLPWSKVICLSSLGVGLCPLQVWTQSSSMHGTNKVAESSIG